MKTIESSLEAWGPDLKGRTVNWYTDNLGGTSVVRKGSMKKDLNQIAVNIADTCKRMGIELELKWIRRDENKIADKLSRFLDLDDWGISPELVESIQKSWGPCTVDRFATDVNRKLNRFNSRFCCPGSEGVDAFAEDWRSELNLLVPPPVMIPEVLRFLVASNARGVLVAPAWRSARFWPILFPCGRRAWFVQDSYEIPDGRRFLISGRQPNSIFTPDRFKGALIVVKMNAENASQYGYS